MKKERLLFLEASASSGQHRMIPCAEMRCTMKQVQHTEDRFSLPGFTSAVRLNGYMNIHYQVYK